MVDEIAWYGNRFIFRLSNSTSYPSEDFPCPKVQSSNGKVLAGVNFSAFTPKKFYLLKLLYTYKFELWHIFKFINSQVAKLNPWENL